MAAPSITAFPEKIINTFLSKWNAASLPIQYTITNDKFPVGEVVTNYFTQVLISINGTLVATIKQIPDSNNETKVDVRKYAQTALKLLRTGTTRDTNASCEIFITGSEEYIDAASLPQSNAITGGGAGVIHFGTLSALPFGGTRGGNMYDYIMDRNKADLGKFMTFFERGQLVDSTDYLISFILNETGYDFEVKQYDINAVLLATQLVSIADEGVGVYRIDLDDITFDSSVDYLTIEILTDTYGTAVSELFNVDADFACISIPTAPSNLTAAANATAPKTSIDLAWTDNSDDETGFIIRRGTTSGALTQIDTVPANVTSYTDTGLDSGTEYFYDVRAIGDINSAPSNEASAITHYDFGNRALFDGVNDGGALVATSLVYTDELTMVHWFSKYFVDADTTPASERMVSIGNNTTIGILQTLKKSAAGKMDPQLLLAGIDTAGNIFLVDDLDRDLDKHLIVVTINTTTKTVTQYVDGVLGSSHVYDLSYVNPITGINMAFTGSADKLESGLIEMRLLKQTMTLQNIEDEWNGGNGGGWIDRNVTDANHLLLYRADSNSGTTMVDDGPDAENLAISNIADSGFGTQLTVSAESGTPTVGDIVTDGTSAATGIVVSHVATDLEIKLLKGLFGAGNTITSPGYSATVDSVLTRFWDEA